MHLAYLAHQVLPAHLVSQRMFSHPIRTITVFRTKRRQEEHQHGDQKASVVVDQDLEVHQGLRDHQGLKDLREVVENQGSLVNQVK